MAAERIIGASRSPGLGLGWGRVAETIASYVPRQKVDRIWLFAPVRSEGREWGTAVISKRLENDRRCVYTASYMMVVRGRGQARVVVEEVGESPAAVVDDVIAGVQRRAGEPEPPEEISPEEWYPSDVVDERPARSEADDGTSQDGASSP